MNGYTLTRAWFDWCRENPEKIRPIHTAIYIYAVETSNRLGWVEKFGFPTDSVMTVLGIGNWRTYNKALNDVVEFGFLKIIRKAPNQHQSTIIAIVKNTVAHTQAEHKQVQKQSSSTAVINKPNKPINKKTRETGLSALKFLENNCNEFMDFFKTEYGYKIKDKKSFAVKFNNKIVVEKIKHEPDVLMAQLENYAISWIKNEERFNNSHQEKSNRPNYF